MRRQPTGLLNRLSYAGTNRVRFEGCVSAWQADHLVLLPGTPSPSLAAKLIQEGEFGKAGQAGPSASVAGHGWPDDETGLPVRGGIPLLVISHIDLGWIAGPAESGGLAGLAGRVTGLPIRAQAIPDQ